MGLSMSRGFSGFAKLFVEDDSAVVYEYGASNWNEPEFSNPECICDGTISIPKTCFVEPKTHEKLKKMPSGKKRLVTKRIPVPVDYGKMLDEGTIVVENCSHCWELTKTEKTVDMMACHLLYQIFREYQLSGRIPEKVGYCV